MNCLKGDIFQIVTASAQSMAEMLQQIVAQFKLADEGQVKGAAPLNAPKPALHHPQMAPQAKNGKNGRHHMEPLKVS